MIVNFFQKLPNKFRWSILLLFSLLSLITISQLIWRAATGFQLDLHVFQDAGQAFRDGAPLYGEGFPDRRGFPFIYPPIAALFFVPLTWAPSVVIQLGWTLTNLLAVWAILAMAFVRLKQREPRLEHPLFLAFLAMGVALPIDPMQRLFQFGQIDIFLVLLIVADLLGFTPKWSRGLLLGFAAGIKITPAAFGLYFLAQRDFKSILRATLGLAISALAGFVVRPKDAILFWTSEVFDSTRAGLPSYEDNQAISGLLSRSGVTGDLLNWLIAAFFIFGAILAFFLVRHFLKAKMPVTALFVLGLCASVFGPYTVSNHWSIIIVGVPLLAVASLENLVAGAVLWIGHWLAPYKIFPADGHVPTDVATVLYGNLQGELSVLFLACMCFEVIRSSRKSHSAGAGEPAASGEPSTPGEPAASREPAISVKPA